MTADLSNFPVIQTNLFVTIDVPDFEVLAFSDYDRTITIDSVEYVPLGVLVNVTESTDELRATAKELTISISGIPEDSVSDVLQNKFRGSEVKIQRAFFEPNTGSLLNIQGNPSGVFQGVVSNFQISDDLPQGEITGSLIINFNCTSFVELLQNKVGGRRTNPIDFEDSSMNSVSVLSKSNFNFGAPTTAVFGTINP